MQSKFKLLLPLTTSLLLLACASDIYVRPTDSPNSSQVNFNAELNSSRTGTDHIQILVFDDPVGCSKHPRGTYVGLLCPNVGPGTACKGLSHQESFETAKPVTVKLEYRAVKEEISVVKKAACTKQFTFVPQKDIQYRVLIRVDQDTCRFGVESSRIGGNWSIDNSVRFDERMCTWL